MISVVDYGVANVGSMLNMLRKVGADAQVVSTPDGVRSAKKLILPGIGAFDHGMTALADRGLADPIRERARDAGVPILGVCLGMQLLGLASEEGTLPGLGLLSARSVRFRFDAATPHKTPHMGWAAVAKAHDSPIFEGLDAEPRFYFVHSYHLVCDDSADVLARATYGVEFTAMVNRANVWGAQFHPEKSHRFGMKLLGNYAAL